MVMVMTKLSRVSLFLFILTYNYLLLRVIIFDYSYNYMEGLGIIAILIVMGLIIGINLILPKSLFQIDFFKSYKKSIYKYFHLFQTIVEAVLLITFSANLLANIFIQDAIFHIILLVILVVICFISNSSSSDCIEIGTMFGLIGNVFLIISLIFMPKLDYSYLRIGQINYLLILAFFLMLFSDNIQLLLNEEKSVLSKPLYISAIAFSLSLILIEYFILICTSGSKYFNGLEYIGFISFLIKPVTRYIGNFEFVYIFFIVVAIVFRYSFKFSLLKRAFNLSNKVFNLVLLILLFVSSSLLEFFYPKNYLVIIIMTVSSGILIFLWFIKEMYNVKKFER